ncbi:DUF3800 domain-containing protein [Streptomyces albidoflavus]|uniref:DUF3800 domain-containing protein n=1 Tax=Streptomyces albidoflavus TaxID=1886 RepID=UPI002E343C40|nr:DUF3800 domain-containing protein [Streptomyces albidoflavus]
MVISLAAGVSLPRQGRPTAHTMHAYIDEAGVRSHKKSASDHFVLSAVIISDEHITEAQDFLERLRRDFRRNPGDCLHWQKLKHEERVHASRVLGAQEWATVSSVVVAKRLIPQETRIFDEDEAYLLTLRYLLERLSWFARDAESVLSYTLSHIVRMEVAKLREYEEQLRSESEETCRIDWNSLSRRGGRVDQPKRTEFLQLADIAASATFKAFDQDKYGNTERRYLESLHPRLYRRGASALTSYGLKMHPWNDNTKAAYPWVTGLGAHVERL